MKRIYSQNVCNLQPQSDTRLGAFQNRESEIRTLPRTLRSHYGDNRHLPDGFPVSPLHCPNNAGLEAKFRYHSPVRKTRKGGETWHILKDNFEGTSWESGASIQATCWK